MSARNSGEDAQALLDLVSTGMTRDLVEEVGTNATGFDVAIEIDAEALAKAAP
jgi:hypothetical protein